MLLGGGYAIAAAVKVSGLTCFIAAALGNAGDGVNLFTFLVVLVLLVATFTEFASNAATANIILPVLAATAVDLNRHPYALLFPAVAACSCAFCFPMATPPNAIVFSSKRLDFGDMLKTGVYLNISSVVLIPVFLLFISFPMNGISTKIPSWAIKDLGSDDC